MTRENRVVMHLFHGLQSMRGAGEKTTVWKKFRRAVDSHSLPGRKEEAIDKIQTRAQKPCFDGILDQQNRRKIEKQEFL